MTQPPSEREAALWAFERVALAHPDRTHDWHLTVVVEALQACGMDQVRAFRQTWANEFYPVKAPGKPVVFVTSQQAVLAVVLSDGMAVNRDGFTAPEATFVEALFKSRGEDWSGWEPNPYVGPAWSNFFDPPRSMQTNAARMLASAYRQEWLEQHLEAPPHVKNGPKARL